MSNSPREVVESFVTRWSFCTNRQKCVKNVREETGCSLQEAKEETDRAILIRDVTHANGDTEVLADCLMKLITKVYQ